MLHKHNTLHNKRKQQHKTPQPTDNKRHAKTNILTPLLPLPSAQNEQIEVPADDTARCGPSRSRPPLQTSTDPPFASTASYTRSTPSRSYAWSGELRVSLILDITRIIGNQILIHRRSVLKEPGAPSTSGAVHSSITNKRARLREAAMYIAVPFTTPFTLL